MPKWRGVTVTPESYKVLTTPGSTGSAPKPPKSKGSSALGGLKNLGKTTLDALSVPQAALFTAIAKGAGKDVSWKNAGGNFYKNTSGETGTTGVLKALGVDNKWARLGIELVADPLWFAAPVKLAKAGSTTAKAVRGVDAVADTAKTARSVGGTLAARTRAIPAKRRQALPSGERGAVVADRFVVKRLNATNERDYRKYGIFELTADGAGRRIVAKTFKDQKDAIRYAKRESHAPRGGQKQIGDDITNSPLLDGPAFQGVDQGRLIDLQTAEGSLGNLRKFWQKEATGGGQVGIKLGVGKHADEGGRGTSGLNYTLKTPINLPERSLGTVSAGNKVLHAVRKDPVEKVSHRLINSFKELAHDLPRQFDEMRGAWKKAGKSEADAKLTYLVAALDNASVTNVAGKGGLGGTVLRDYLASKGMWDQRNDELLSHFRDRWAEMGRQTGKVKNDWQGPYATQGPADTFLKAESDARKAANLPRNLFAPSNPTILNAERARKHGSPFEYTDAATFEKMLAEAGIDPDTAADITKLIDTHTKEADELLKRGLEDKRFGFQEKPDERGLVPELDLFTLAARREETHYKKLAEQEIDRLVAEAGIADEMGDDIAKGVLSALKGKDNVNLSAVRGTTASTKTGKIIEKWVPRYKGLLTTVNVSHFVNNWLGDLFNRNINGNFRHMNPVSALGVTGKPGERGARLGSAAFKLAAKDKRELVKSYEILGRTYSGEEVLLMSHLAGLGRGYVGEDIAGFLKVEEASRNPAMKYYRFMQRQNQSREDAQRIDTWLKHMRAGDDPLTAQAKTLRVHFDYSDLTDFERNTLRNALMFYTWMKKNALLQGSGVVTRPGLYAAVGDMERNREVFPNEPDYFSMQGAVPTPWGNWTFANPATDLFKADAGNLSEMVRKNVLGALAPQYKIPIEMATGKNLFTGGDLEKYEGQRVPSWITMLPGVGKSTTAQAGGEQTEGVPWQLAYLAAQFGPAASAANTATRPDAEASSSPSAILGRLGLMPRFQENDPLRFAKNAAVRERKKKADETRRKNAQDGN